jgi:hypothetical protein
MLNKLGNTLDDIDSGIVGTVVDPTSSDPRVIPTFNGCVPTHAVHVVVEVVLKLMWCFAQVCAIWSSYWRGGVLELRSNRGL